MSREIKFRAWYSDQGLMCDVDRFDFPNKQMIVYHHGFWNGQETCEIDDLPIMQFTGLKDKNGVGIFEGDIVSTCLSDIKGEARWGRIIIKNPFEYSVEEALYIIHADELEVVGNVFDNPELLESRDV